MRSSPFKCNITNTSEKKKSLDSNEPRIMISIRRSWDYRAYPLCREWSDGLSERGLCALFQVGEVVQNACWGLLACRPLRPGRTRRVRRADADACVVRPGRSGRLRPLPCSSPSSSWSPSSGPMAAVSRPRPHLHQVLHQVLHRDRRSTSPPSRRPLSTTTKVRIDCLAPAICPLFWLGESCEISRCGHIWSIYSRTMRDNVTYSMHGLECSWSEQSGNELIICLCSLVKNRVWKERSSVIRHIHNCSGHHFFWVPLASADVRELRPLCRQGLG